MIDSMHLLIVGTWVHYFDCSFINSLEKEVHHMYSKIIKYVPVALVDTAGVIEEAFLGVASPNGVPRQFGPRLSLGRQCSLEFGVNDPRDLISTYPSFLFRFCGMVPRNRTSARE